MIVITVLPVQEGFPCQVLPHQMEKLDAVEGLNSEEQHLRAIFPLSEQAPAGYLQPHVYLHRRPKHTAGYVLQGGNLVYQTRNEQEFRYVKLYIPATTDLPALAIGARGKGEAVGALEFFQEMQGRGSEMPHYSLANFDLPAIASKYPDDHWLWSFKGNNGYVTGGRLTGVGIEKDSLVQAVKKSSTAKEVGVILQAVDASLKVRILTAGRVQFPQFTDEHLVQAKHPELGDPWPMIVQIMQTLKLFMG